MYDEYMHSKTAGKPLSILNYARIFNTEFNHAFHPPQNDQ